ncbi:D-2-hydroxyacid dehydrogenase [Promicromonospora citrea]|uniref:2-hydroxyacid dehydrogenase n=1 Tax=Promicromonospora citrea TaxID=43677 RepID=A0A8H9GJL6_9MICO|nr:D-2-hydroxyacid dehydrogenase [Promicromonospora citrea]NNH54556.1 D-2-hydroxyacid dehydrogenase [Promicromonospora citrea]GGM31403.1 2-hydroxyacid dehydrogenase [Promicromonospora citrea]
MSDVVPDVLVVRGGLGERVVAAVRAAHPGLEVAAADDPAARAAATVATGRFSDEEIAAMPRLAWVHSWAAGVEGDVGPALRRRATAPEAGSTPVTVTSSAGNGAIPLAEQALLLTLMLDRQAPRWAQAQREHRWERFTHDELHGRTLGIYGYGNVGRELAARARAFGMEVVGLRRRPAGPDDPVDRMLPADAVDELAAASDVLVVAAPLTDETAGAITLRTLRALGPRGYLVVVSRGGIVVEPDLVAALRDGVIAGAGLDAHATEPLPADSPLWDLPNTIVTPHNGATTPATADRGAAIFLDNLDRWLARRPLRNVVDVGRLP